MEEKHIKYSIKELGREYNEEMLKILRENPIVSSGLTICFDRKPDIFKKGEIKHEPSKYVGFLKDNKLCGFASIGFYKAYMMGKQDTVFYCSDAYVRKSARRQGFLDKTSTLLFKEAYRDSNWGYCIVLRGNKNAESYISKKKKDNSLLPYHKVIGTLDARNIIITFKKKESKTYVVRKASAKDTNVIISLLKEEFSKRLFAPYIDKETFLLNLSKRPNFNIENYYVAEKEGSIVGVCAAWDCTGFKQTRIMKYGGKYKFTKILYSILSGLLGFPPLPLQGRTFRDLYIVDYAVKGNKAIILNALLRKIYNEHRKLNYNTVIFGSYQSDGLLKAVNGFFNQAVKSHIIAFSYNETLLSTINEKSSKPYIDIALL